jgi:hypothetical protein
MPDTESRSGGTEQRDLGVAAVGGLVCQNFEAHPNEEVKMQSGPNEGVRCPECGRMAGGGPPLNIPFVDEFTRNAREVNADTDQRGDADE